MRPNKNLVNRINSLKAHLEQESPLLVDVVDYFQQLDKVGYQVGVLKADESFANRISWWPLVSVLGTFSAGKSSFINTFVDAQLQQTGNQAVDDKFTVMTFSGDEEVRVLPGLALDADPRFPFYQISEEIEKVSKGDGARIDSYLQLKTCRSEKLRGKILIDSPGFDADDQRSAILKISDHIIDLSDLVIVFFDARHPEPGAMKDTLQHLVSSTIERNDTNKFIFVLNQIDTTARDDNLEEVVAAWQKAISQTGMTAGTFYCIYNDKVAVEIADKSVRERYELRKDRDLAKIMARIDKVGVERVYRIIGALENTTNKIEQQWMPKVQTAWLQFRRRVLSVDAVLLAGLVAMALFMSTSVGGLLGLKEALLSDWVWQLGAIALLAAAFWLHLQARKFFAGSILKRMRRNLENGYVQTAFERNTRLSHSILGKGLIGWGRGARNKLADIRQAADGFVQNLNDNYTDPSGSPQQQVKAETQAASTEAS